MRYLPLTDPHCRAVTAIAAGLSLIFIAATALADSGVSDDRVSLPEGPGSTEGIGENVSIDPNMGLMRHGVAINLPAGFASVTPTVALGYSSGSGSSIVGVGWDMSWPSIERMTMRGVPRYEEQDLFVAGGGSELVRISEQSLEASEPAIYRARFEKGFVRYLWHARDGGSGGYWEAQYPDGTVGFYGADADGVLVTEALEQGKQGETFKYHLVEKVDVFGHRMRHTYIKDGAHSLLTGIGYVFTDGATPTYEVTMDYGPRTDWLSDAKSGFERVMTQRLTGIRVMTRGQLVRRYGLNYEDYEASDGRSRLKSVEQFGLGGTRYPVTHSFGYSRALGAQCGNADCGQPYLVEMVGDAGLGISLASGKASLIDINGDALPDLVDTANTNPQHRFFINRLASDGSHTFDTTPTVSSLGTPTGFPLDNPRVQMLDINGDGFTDVVNGFSGEALINRGGGDWDELLQLDAANGYPSVGDDVELRFMDYNNDMRIDLVRSGIGSATAYENTGKLGFVERSLGDLGTQFSEGVQFTDMNGDGLLDIVQLLPNQLRYRLNLGWGVFVDWVILETPFSGSDVALASLEDLNGDGYADIAVTSGTQVSYVLNRNGERFDPIQTIAQAGGQVLPERGPNTLVLSADMNGNGSTDIVWVGENGGVRYLELFPVRPHLLTRIENGLGRVTDITYQTSVEQRALAAEEARPWVNPLPHPMVVVSRVDEWDKLSLVRDVREYRYFNGFYDGKERQFRGYSDVETLMPQAPSSLQGRVVSKYDVGAVQAHRNGLHLETTRFSDGKVIDVSTNTYGDDDSCPVAEVPSPAEFEAQGLRAVRFPCEVQSELVLQEGLAEDRWLTTRKEKAYDGYGNVIRNLAHGVVSSGAAAGGACAPCTPSPGTHGQACGQACLGDEATTETTFVPPNATGGRWILNRPARMRTFARDGDSKVAETVYAYDGDAFVGLPEGQLTQGKVTRTSRKVAEGVFIDTTRSAFDEHGNIIESLDPLGVPNGTTHRRVYGMDEDGLRIASVSLLLETPDGSPYTLTRNIRYEPTFDRPQLASQWVRFVAGEPQTGNDDMAYTYDVLGRLESIVFAGDTGVEPTFAFEYALGDPTSAMTTHRRSTSGAATDLEGIKCSDGRGRTYQVRRKVAPGRYLVDGFTVFNLRSQQLRVYQAYEGTSATCDDVPPEGVRHIAMRYDGVGRLIETQHPDADESGAPSTTRMVYEPLVELTYDAEDSDPSSPHFDTPLMRSSDGLGRAATLSRSLALGQQESTTLRYDALGHLTHLIDANGNQKIQTYDLKGRLQQVQDPSAGTTTFEYDDADNLVKRTDGRGVTTELAYDGTNRISAMWDASAPETSLITHEYDVSTACDPALCTNGAGLRVATLYPGGARYIGYDRRRRTLAEGRSFGGQTYVITNEYDAADRLTARVYPDGTRLARVYDGANRLTAIPTVVSDITYDTRGLTASMTRANGTVDTFDNDSRQRLSGLTTTGPDGAVLQQIQLTRNRMDSILSVADTAPGALMPAAEHTYDAWQRLVKGAPGAPQDTFSYDAIDNLLSHGATIFQYDAARPGAKSRAGQRVLGYDASGYLTTAGDWTHTWDYQNRLTESRSGVQDGPHATSVVSSYGGNHERVARSSGGFSTRYVSNDFEVRDGIAVIYPRLGNNRLARIETTSSAPMWLGDPVADGVVDAADAWVAQSNGDAPGGFLASAARRVLAETRSDVVQLHANHLRSLALATGDDGAVEGRHTFKVYGSTAAQEGFVDRYGFTGQEHDPLTGLIHFEYRFLDPSLAQWISPDPMFSVASTDTLAKPVQLVARYAYALNNPTSFIDPDGRATPPKAASITNRGKVAKHDKWKPDGRGGKASSKAGRAFLHRRQIFGIRNNKAQLRALRPAWGGRSKSYQWVLTKNNGDWKVSIAPDKNSTGHASLAFTAITKRYDGIAAAGQLKYSWGRWRMTAAQNNLGEGVRQPDSRQQWKNQKNNMLYAASILQRGHGFRGKISVRPFKARFVYRANKLRQ